MKILGALALMSVFAFGGCAQFQSAVASGEANAAGMVACSLVSKTAPQDQLCLSVAGVAISVGSAVVSGEIKL